MSYNQYYNELPTEDLISSPQWTETFSYSETFNHYPTEADLLDIGVYVEGNNLMKNFTMSIDGNPSSIKFRMTVEVIPGTGEYRVFPRGVSIDSSINDFIDNTLLAFGYRGDNYTKEDITLLMLDDYEGTDIDVESKIINGIIDIYGQSKYDYNLMDLVYNYIEAFPNIDNPCVVNQKPLPEGQSYVSIYDHSDLINNVVAYNNNGAVSNIYTPLQLKNVLDSLYTNDSKFKSIISNAQLVRICYYQVSPISIYMYVNGYTLENASIVTTTDSANNQHYSGLVTHVKGGKWLAAQNTYGDMNFHFQEEWDNSYNKTATFYNYLRTDWYNYMGLPFDAQVGSGPIIDSIGSVSNLTPIQPISNLHTKWYEPDVNDVYKPVGHKPTDPTVPDIDVQPIIRRGIPPVIIRPRPTIGHIPNPYIDPSQPETFDDWVTLPVTANIYHPTVDDVSDLFGWLWDRDTWTDAQEMNSNPMEVIISLHTLPLPNQVPYKEDGTSAYWYANEVYKPIVLGYMVAQQPNSETPATIDSNIVTSRVCHYCFGHVDIPRTSLDYRDYDREIYIYLPYVGFKQIRCDDITPYLNPNLDEFFAELYLDYFIDVATGDFEAIISINKNVSDRKVLYMFTGNMAVPVPLYATDKTRLEQARWNTLINAGNTVLGLGGTALMAGLGNPAGALSMFAASTNYGLKLADSLNTLKNQNVVSVNRCGTLASNVGAMCPKTPYVVINTPIGYDTIYTPYSGQSANVTTQLGVLSGFVKCKYVHVDTSASITLAERDEIENALLNGVIF